MEVADGGRSLCLLLASLEFFLLGVSDSELGKPFVEEEVFDFFVFEESSLVLFCIDNAKVLFFRHGQKVHELENPFNPHPASSIASPDLGPASRFGYRGNHELVWYCDNSAVKLVTFRSPGAVSIGEDLDLWEISLSKAPALVVEVVHHAASRRLIGLYQRHDQRHCLRTLSLASLKAETIPFDAPADEFHFFRGRLG